MSENVVDAVVEPEVQEVQVEVYETPKPKLHIPTSTDVGQALLNAGAGIVAGMVIQKACSGITYLARRAFEAGNKKATELKLAAQERKAIKAAAKVAKEETEEA